MKLRKFDEVQIADIHPTNPITGESIADLLQCFAVTRDVEGTHIPPDALHPRIPAGDKPIAMSRIVRLNWKPVSRVTL